ncbi:MAG: hypothetical protein AAFO94_19160, partial [Bacteroidota bacterium]
MFVPNVGRECVGQIFQLAGRLLFIAKAKVKPVLSVGALFVDANLLFEGIVDLDGFIYFFGSDQKIGQLVIIVFILL